MIEEVKTIGNPFTFFKDGNLTTRTAIKEERKRKEVEKAEQGYHQFKRKLQAPQGGELYTVEELVRIFTCKDSKIIELAKEFGRTESAIKNGIYYFGEYIKYGEIGLDNTWRNETFITAAEKVIREK